MEDTVKEFHVSELARLTKMSPTTISNHLNNLKKKGLYSKKRKGS
ncbi:helix-turn-helix transcriptional regulator [Candidatus Woesearchaeota archaeon]|nr:helix-turn-helix transcriptional regulator [Candidatus Woesearchaeota archaeon]